MTHQTSRGFNLLDERVRHWVWTQGWRELREAQERAIEPILQGVDDVIIAAATAAGKTEAAFLPIGSALLTSPTPGLVLYISPLKALINDQFQRLGDFFGALDLPVYPWHGDIASTAKQKFEKTPFGALLITPESLEGLFVRKGFYMAHNFRYLRYVVVDELHSFIGSERGVQVTSQLNRLEMGLGRRVPRIGLSATLGDMAIAKQCLRPADPLAVREVETPSSASTLRVLVKGYRESRLLLDEDEEETASIALRQVADSLFATLRGTKNLVFANSRRQVEEVADAVSRIYEANGLPTEFHAHHGSLSKELREDVETLLKEPDRPATAVCTSTLEMGIDLGSVKSVSQLSPPFSVASLRQRVGRSGRRGEAAILRAYLIEPADDEELAFEDRLRLDLVQTLACIELLTRRWCEAPPHGARHYSTLIHQLLSLIAERGGIRPEEAFEILCRRGPFPVDAGRFKLLLQELGRHRLLIQTDDRTLLHGEVGEKLVNHYSFYPTFWTSEEFRLLHGTRHLGNLAVSQPVAQGSLIVFGGRRWCVKEVREQERLIEVVPAQGGRAPRFSGSGVGNVDRIVHQEMLALYRSDSVPVYLDSGAKSLLQEGRAHFARREVGAQSLLGSAGATLLFLWAGTRIANTLAVKLQSDSWEVGNFEVGLRVRDAEPQELRELLRHYAAEDPPRAEALAETVPHKAMEKFDHFLPTALLNEGYGAAYLDPPGAWKILHQLFG